MKINFATKIKFILTGGLLCISTGRADPLLTSWFTANTGLYARVYTRSANRAAGIASTTWSGQTLPT